MSLLLSSSAPPAAPSSLSAPSAGDSSLVASPLSVGAVELRAWRDAAPMAVVDGALTTDPLFARRTPPGEMPRPRPPMTHAKRRTMRRQQKAHRRQRRTDAALERAHAAPWRHLVQQLTDRLAGQRDASGQLRLCRAVLLLLRLRRVAARARSLASVDEAVRAARVSVLDVQWAASEPPLPTALQAIMRELHGTIDHVMQAERVACVCSPSATAGRTEQPRRIRLQCGHWHCRACIMQVCAAEGRCLVSVCEAPIGYVHAEDASGEAVHPTRAGSLVRLAALRWAYARRAIVPPAPLADRWLIAHADALTAPERREWHFMVAFFGVELGSLSSAYNAPTEAADEGRPPARMPLVGVETNPGPWRLTVRRGPVLHYRPALDPRIHAAAARYERYGDHRSRRSDVEAEIARGGTDVYSAFSALRYYALARLASRLRLRSVARSAAACAADVRTAHLLWRQADLGAGLSPAERVAWRQHARRESRHAYAQARRHARRAAISDDRTMRMLVGAHELWSHFMVQEDRWQRRREQELERLNAVQMRVWSAQERAPMELRIGTARMPDLLFRTQHPTAVIAREHAIHHFRLAHAGRAWRGEYVVAIVRRRRDGQLWCQTPRMMPLHVLRAATGWTGAHFAATPFATCMLRRSSGCALECVTEVIANARDYARLGLAAHCDNACDRAGVRMRREESEIDQLQRGGAARHAAAPQDDREATEGHRPAVHFHPYAPMAYARAPPVLLLLARAHSVARRRIAASISFYEQYRMHCPDDEFDRALDVAHGELAAADRTTRHYRRWAAHARLVGVETYPGPPPSDRACAPRATEHCVAEQRRGAVAHVRMELDGDVAYDYIAHGWSGYGPDACDGVHLPGGMRLVHGMTCDEYEAVAWAMKHAVAPLVHTSAWDGWFTPSDQATMRIEQFVVTHARVWSHAQVHAANGAHAAGDAPAAHSTLTHDLHLAAERLRDQHAA